MGGHSVLCPCGKTIRISNDKLFIRNGWLYALKNIKCKCGEILVREERQ